MPTQKTRKGRIVERYVLKYSDALKRGTMKKRALSRMILEDYPDDFKDEDSIRSLIRTQTGSRHRNDRKNQGNIIDAKSEYSGQLPIPKSAAKDVPNYEINQPGTWLIFSDVHFPYHDEQALKVMLEYVQGKELAGVIINGDLVDNYKASRWLKDGSKPDLKYEYDMTRQWLKDFKEVVGCRVVWKFGNHDERLALYLMQNVPELSVYISTFVESIFNLKELDIELVKSSQIIELGKLLVLHGHEFMQSVYSPVNAARGLFLRAKTSAIIGHLHMTSEHAEGNLKGDRIVCYSLGCLCNLRPEYAPTAFTRWNHGFALVDLEADGSYTVHNKKIVEGKVR